MTIFILKWKYYLRHRFCGVVSHGHSGNLFLDSSIGINFCSKLLPLCSMFHGFGDASPHGTGQSSSHAKATIVEDLHGHFEAVAKATQNIFSGNGDVLEK